MPCNLSRRRQSDAEHLEENLAQAHQLMTWQLTDYRYKRPNHHKLKQILTLQKKVRKLQSICSYLEVMLLSAPDLLESSVRAKLWKEWLTFEEPSKQMAAEETQIHRVLKDLYQHIEQVHVLLHKTTGSPFP